LIYSANHSFQKTDLYQFLKEGENYLERTWGPEKLKKAREFDALFSDTAPTTSTSDSHGSTEPPAKRPKLAKHSTMMVTTKA